MGKKVLVFLMAGGILCGFSASLLSAQTDYPSCSAFGVQRFQEKKATAPFSLKDTDGRQVSLNDTKGKPALFIFWASYCEACKEDMVLIEKFAQGRREQFNIFTFVIDGENEKRVRRTIKNHKITFPVFLDVKEKVARSYGVRMVPTTFLINSEGMMVGMIVGQRDWAAPEAWSAMKELFALH